jgi:hypothetical protein
MDSKFKIGDQVHKPSGYKFDGTVVSVFKTTSSLTRIVAEMKDNGMLHIFNENQLELGWQQGEDPWKEVVHLSRVLPNDHDFGRAVRLHVWETTSDK